MTTTSEYEFESLDIDALIDNCDTLELTITGKIKRRKKSVAHSDSDSNSCATDACTTDSDKMDMSPNELCPLDLDLIDSLDTGRDANERKCKPKRTFGPVHKDETRLRRKCAEQFVQEHAGRIVEMLEKAPRRKPMDVLPPPLDGPLLSDEVRKTYRIWRGVCGRRCGDDVTYIASLYSVRIQPSALKLDMDFTAHMFDDPRDCRAFTIELMRAFEGYFRERHPGCYPNKYMKQ